LIRKQFCQGTRPLVFRTGKNHLSHCVNAIAFEEHVLGATEPNAFRTECDCVCNLLGRIRTIVLGGVYMFIALCIAVSCYPFDPRTLLSGILLCLFIAFGGVVVFTYADMHRDATLSHITNTKPGELGSEFWFKVIGYGAAPLLGLITQVFPEWSGFLFSWLQPGLSSLK